MSNQISKDHEPHLWLARWTEDGAPIHGYPKWQYELVVLDPEHPFRRGTTATHAAEQILDRFSHYPDISVIHVRPLMVPELDDKEQWSSFDVIPSKVELRERVRA